MIGKLFIISAPSGAGKTTLVDVLIFRICLFCPIRRVITYTCKQPRSSEENGKHYHFICKREFEDKIKHGFFMEWSQAYGYYYGSPRSVISQVERGFSYILIVDRLGAELIAQIYPQAILIWIYTKDIDVLRQRLAQRNSEDVKQVELRLECARREIAEECRAPLYRYHILNDDFDRAVRKLEKIILQELGSDTLSHF